jgi:hypothetical protein
MGNACIVSAIQSRRRSNQALNEDVNHSVLGSFEDSPPHDDAPILTSAVLASLVPILENNAQKNETNKQTQK